MQARSAPGPVPDRRPGVAPYTPRVDDLLLHVLRYIHLVGVAMLFGGALAQFLSGTLRINRAMLWGSIVQVLSGLALAAPLRPEGEEPPVGKLVVKLVLAVMIFVMVFVPRRREQVNRGHFLAILGLTLVTAAVGTFWR
jgi:hypothetical protein